MASWWLPFGVSDQTEADRAISDNAPERHPTSMTGPNRTADKV